jgi:hypothetical protein
MKEKKLRLLWESHARRNGMHSPNLAARTTAPRRPVIDFPFFAPFIFHLTNEAWIKFDNGYVRAQNSILRCQ